VVAVLLRAAEPFRLVDDLVRWRHDDRRGRPDPAYFKAEKAGTVAYVCTIHPGMEGTLTVEG